MYKYVVVKYRYRSTGLPFNSNSYDVSRADMVVGLAKDYAAFHRDRIVEVYIEGVDVSYEKCADSNGIGKKITTYQRFETLFKN